MKVNLLQYLKNFWSSYLSTQSIQAEHASKLFESADACAGRDPQRAAELRTAARDHLKVS